MIWYVVTNGSGEAVSMGTVLANPMPSGLTAVALSDADADGILAGEKRWDAATQAVVSVTPPVPDWVSPWQLETAIIHLLNQPGTIIDDAIAAMPEGPAKWQARADRTKATMVKRDHPLINAMAAGEPFNMSAEQVDDLFRYAATLQG